MDFSSYQIQEIGRSCTFLLFRELECMKIKQIEIHISKRNQVQRNFCRYRKKASFTYTFFDLIFKEYAKRYSEDALHCVKSVQIRSFFWSVFSHIWTEHGEKLPYLETFHSDRKHVIITKVRVQSQSQWHSPLFHNILSLMEYWLEKAHCVVSLQRLNSDQA